MGNDFTVSMQIEYQPADLIQRMEKYPEQLDKVMKVAAQASMLAMQEAVPPYPPPLPNQVYERTGQLGRSLTVNGAGNIGDIKAMGPPGSYAVTFGTNLSYAADVIGPQQKPIFKGRWWTIKDVAKLAQPKILTIFDTVAKRLVQFLDGK